MHPTTIPNAYRNPLEVERLLSENSLRRSLAADNRITVDRHAAFQKSLTTRETFDDDIDDLIEIDPFNGDPPSKRKDKDVGRLLGLLDSLERGNG
jgi:hypothetical protein